MIKIFYTKKDRELVDNLREEIKKLKKEKEKSDKIISNNEFVFLNDLSKEKDKNIELTKELELINSNHNELLEKYNSSVKENKKIIDENSNFRMQIDKLINDVEIAEKKIEDLQSDRYLKVEVPTKNRSHKQTMKIKSGVRTGKIMKGVKNG